MAKKRNVTNVTPDKVRSISRRIEDLFANTRSLHCTILVHSLSPQLYDQQLLVDMVNRLLDDAESLGQQDSTLFLFERCYCATHDACELLDGRYTSHHQRAFEIAYGFLMALLTHEAQNFFLDDPETYRRPPRRLARLDLESAYIIAESYKSVLYVDEITTQLAVEAALAANLVADNTKQIPPQFRTRIMSKKQAVAHLRPGNEDSGVRWLNDCIEKGVIHCQKISRQCHVFDWREFPEKVLDRIKP